jgi:outer membrane protein TolC
LDIYLAYDAVAEAEIKLSEIEMELAQAKAHLARVLGIEEPGVSLVVAGRPTEPPDQLPEMKAAFVQAFTHRLDVRLTQIKITEAERELRYQKSRPIRELRAGVNWEKESSGDQGIGPQIEAELPILNLNQGQIAKANFMIRMAKKKLLAKQGQVREQIIHDLESIAFLKRKIDQFDRRIIPLKQKAFEYTQRWAMLMQINRVLMLETQKELFESYLELIRAKRDFYQAINDLEYHLGGRWY